MKHFTNQSYGSQAGRMNSGGAKFRRFALFPLMLLMLFLLPANMVAQTSASSSKYIATYESSTQTLTFKKFVGETLPDNSVVVEDKMRVDAINKNLGNGTIVHIVFDKSFSTYKPTSLSYFFNRLTKLETITGLEYLNTEKVTDMSYMFYNCVALTSLDVTKFNTANVKNMGNMFYSCSALTSLDVTKFNTENVANMSYMFYSCSSLKSLDVTHFNTANVKNMTSMFSGCSSLTSLDVTHFNTANVTNMISMFSVCSKLTSLNVTNFNTANVKSMSHMFNSCSSLTSLYLTNFNTEKVTNMERMFSDCQALTTIYTSSEFVTTQVSKSSGMFTNCEKLKGEEVWKKYKATDKTYAKIEGGYFSVGIPMVKYADGTLTFFLASKETLGENEYELNSGKNLPGWMKHTLGITKVVFDTSFANARPTSCYKWFYWCENLKQVEGIKNLNTKEVTNMVDMFCECRYLSSLDVSGFNTEKVTDMSEMFYDCISLKLLDIAKFNTANVTNMQGMFYSCSALTTIYASDKFVTGQVTDGSNMFSNCTNLKGFVDYKNNSDKTDHIFANYKTGYFSKLVGKNGDEKIGATGETLAAEKLVLADDKDFVAYEPFAAKTASYSRTMKEGTIWATLCLPFEVTLDGQNFRAFKLLSADDATETVELEEIKTSIAAGTPVIIKMKDGATQLKFSEADKAIAKDVQTSKTANSNYQLQGLYTQKMFSKDTDNNCYIVKGDKLMNPAKLLDKTTTESVGSKPFRAYMVDNSSAPAAGARMFSISGGTTAIEQLETTADSKAEYYDLQGRRLPDLQKGVNIVKRGGKTMKVIIK